jgi:hypothetical protein
LHDCNITPFGIPPLGLFYDHMKEIAAYDVNLINGKRISPEEKIFLGGATFENRLIH